MASSLTEEAVNYALKAVGKQNITLKEKQLSILKLTVLEKKDVLAVLPTGFGKSLIYQTIAPFADFIERDESTERGKSIVIVISPLNALIKDQVTKLRETGLRACILKADRVASDCQDIEEVSISSSEELENLANFQLLYAHPEALVESRQVLKLLKKEEFQNRIRAIVVDEAHLVVDWYVHLLKCNTLINKVFYVVIKLLSCYWNIHCLPQDMANCCLFLPDYTVQGLFCNIVVIMIQNRRNKY